VIETALLYVTFPDQDAAARVAEAVIDERLAACANLLAPCLSIYRWEGEVERSREARALFKTTPALAKKLRDRIAELHPYDLPVIESWPVGVGSAAAAWIAAATR
jgi:periplasmic divalent cation tolerance protein